MIAVIRISGEVGINKEVKETLSRLRLRRKYSCVLFDKPKKETLGMIRRVKDFVAFGEIKTETLSMLIEKRAKLLDKSKKLDVKTIVSGLESGKKPEELNIKPFFRLHPPRKGIDSRKHFGVGKGVLGNNKDQLNKLLERML